MGNLSLNNNVATKLCQQFENAFGVKLTEVAGEEAFVNAFRRKFDDSEITQLCSDLENGVEVNM